MIALIQRVAWAQVEVDQQIIGRIERGILALIAVEKADTSTQAQRLLERMLHYRIFPDSAGRMNLSLLDIEGAILLVPQFTLAADTRKGNRPSFTPAAEPQAGADLFETLTQAAREHPIQIEQGRFGADMQVSLCNDGPVTFSLRT